MLARQWLNTADQLPAGVVVYTSPRRFQLWAQTVSHGQLLLRSTIDTDNATRVDLMFKPVSAQRTRSLYDGLQIRCATTAEADIVLGDAAHELLRYGRHLLHIDSSGTSDWVVAGAVGWREDTSTGDISAFAYHDEQSPPAITPRILDGANGGMASGLADIDDVITAIRTGRPHSAGPRHAHVHLVMVTLDFDGREHTGVAGGFVTRRAAEQHLASVPPRRDVRYWIDTVPVRLS